jgi:ATP-dependent helicase Lhr and Lhr-like helicase
VEKALWELVTIGLVTADGFDALRALLNKRRDASRSGAGRWSLLRRDSVETPDMESICNMLLNRYGVVFRDLLQRETLLPPWRELLMMFRKMEDRGQIRSGKFVSGFMGQQFALPLAVDSLRASRKDQIPEFPTSVSAADPLNLVGIILPGDRISSISLDRVLLSFTV